VGLPLLIEFARAGFHVTGFENDPRKVEALNQGKSYVPDIPSPGLQEILKSGRVAFTTDSQSLHEMDSIHICVPTPLVKTKDPDLSYILNATREVAAGLRRGQLIVLESTTYLGTTKEIVLPLLEARGLQVGIDYFLAFSPERIDPGNARYSLKNTPKVVGGMTRDCTKLAEKVYAAAVERVVTVSSPKAAEMVKLLENTFRAVNIGLVNEISMICEKLGINIWEVIDAAATKPFGFIPFYPGPGLGGHCIPVDPQYLAWKMRFLNYRTKFIDLAEEINTAMPGFIVSRIADALNARKKSIRSSVILILGIAYKKNIGDVRESPALSIIDLLLEKGAKVSYNDPHLPGGYRHRGLSSVSLSPSLLREADCVTICTDHDQYDYPWIVKESSLIMDCRNATRDVLKGSDKIILL